MIRKIVEHPDPVLRKMCDPVDRFDDMLTALADDMLETMYDAPGRGLAAPQVGITRRMFVMDVTWKEGRRSPMIFVNPQIRAVSTMTASLEEGCLSIPGDLTWVTRPASVRMCWQDLQGTEHSEEFTGFAAACVQHELDHLNGVLCIDYRKDEHAG